MRPMMVAVGEMVAVTVGFVLAGVAMAAVVGLGIMVWSIRRAKVLVVPAEQAAMRGDAAVLSARIEMLADSLRQRAEEATQIATQIKEGR